MGKMRQPQKILVEKLEVKSNVRDLVVDGRIILK
jgi:hypothetical protein